MAIYCPNTSIVYLLLQNLFIIKHISIATAYSSKDPCDNEYRGSSPEDELEVRNIVNFLSSRADGFIAFLTYHSYGQRFITRWDYSKEVIPTDHDQLVSACGTHDTHYTTL